MKVPKLNWPLWAGFLLTLIAFLSYFFVFVWFETTRDFPWANLILFAGAGLLLGLGLRRAFRPNRPKPRLSKVAGAILSSLSVAIFGLFIFAVFIFARQLPRLRALRRWARRRRTSRSPIQTATWCRSRAYWLSVMRKGRSQKAFYSFSIEVTGDHHATPSFGAYRIALLNLKRWGSVRLGSL